MLRGSGPALAAAAAAAAVAREELSLPCHRVPAEEGEGRDAAFPVPPAWLNLRGLRLPGNAKAAAGPDSARGLLVGAGPELFGTPSRGKRLRGGQAGAPGAVGGVVGLACARIRAAEPSGGCGAGPRRREVGHCRRLLSVSDPLFPSPGPYGAWFAGAGAPAALPLSLISLCRPIEDGDRGPGTSRWASEFREPRSAAARLLPLEHAGWLAASPELRPPPAGR